jgi:transcriptional regulator with XRE-family HTH domain
MQQMAMTPPEFRLCLDLLSWSQRDLARMLGLDDRSVRRWSSGQNEIPGDIADWLATLTAFHAKHPAPLKGGLSNCTRCIWMMHGGE